MTLLKNFLQKIEEINPWHFLWIGIVFSEFFTLIMNTVLSLLWWGYVSIDLLLIGTIDAFVVAFLVSAIIIYFVNRIKETKITNRQLLQAEKLAASSSITASIAHEFGNPLYGIKGVLTSILKQDNLSEKNTQMVGMALDECDRMEKMLRNLQDFNRPASGEKILTNIHRIIDDIIIFSRGILERNNIEIRKEYDPDLRPILVVTDQIKQVVMNLINNSIQACAGGGMIRISTSEEKANVVIRIEDNGHGIGAEDLPRIFDPFFTTRDAQGTGLGLSVSYGIIRQHGGTIEVASKAGEGTSFTIILPKTSSQD